MNIQPIFKKKSYKLYTKITRSFYLTVAVFISIPCLLLSCGSGTNSSESSDVVSTQIQPPIFFLAPGLNTTPDCFDSFKEALSKRFPGASIVVSKSVTCEETSSLSIAKQVKKSYQEVSKIPEVQTQPIILIGHSQGGVRMASLATKCKKEGLNVKIVTINAPFEGASGLRFKDLASLKKTLQASVKKHLQPYAKYLGFIESYVIKNLVASFFEADGQRTNQPGVKDLVPGSPFLLDLQNQLSKIDIPILAIGGVAPKIDFYEICNRINTDLSTLAVLFLNIDKATLQAKLNAGFDCVLNDILVGENSKKEHDTLLSLSTQIGQTFFDNMKNVHASIISDTIHCHPSDSDTFFGGMGLIGTLNSPKTVDEVEKFVKGKS